MCTRPASVSPFELVKMRRHRIRHPREELRVTGSENLPEAPDGIPGVSWWQDDPNLEALFAEVGDDLAERLVGGEFEKVAEGSKLPISRYRPIVRRHRCPRST